MVTKKITKDHWGERGGGHQKITEDHYQKEGRHEKKWAKLKVVIKDIITPRISVQWVVQELISSQTNIDLSVYLKQRLAEFPLSKYLLPPPFSHTYRRL